MKIYKQKNNIKLEEIDNEYFLVPSNNDFSEIISLNNTASLIWKSTNGRNSIDIIAKIVSQEYNVKLESALKDIENFYSELADFVELVSK